MTRRIVLFMQLSADGFFEGPDGDISWHRVDEELHQHFNDRLSDMTAFLEGRRSYELMQDFWPTADQDPQSTPTVREFAGIWRRTPKVVYSRTLAGVGPDARIEREVDPAALRALKEQPGGDMALGGADLAATFVRHGLVDEFQLYVHPVLIGRGRRLFADDVHLDLDLVESRPFGNGVVLLRYAPSP